MNSEGTKAIKLYYDKYYLPSHKDYITEERSDSEARFLIDLLGKKPKSVCDVGCGNGRHLAALHKLGVTSGEGVDASKELCKQTKNSLPSTFNITCDTFSNWHPKGIYDLNYSLFSSFSYCITDKQARELIHKMVVSTNKKGLIVIDVDNIFRLIRFLDGKEKRKMRTKEETYLDASTNILHAKEFFGKDIIETETRYFTAPDFQTMFANEGLKNITFYGDITKNPYTTQSPRLIVVAKK